MVQFYQNEHRLTTPKNVAVEFIKAESGQVVISQELPTTVSIDAAKIASVLKLDYRKSCLLCPGEVFEIAITSDVQKLKKS